MGGGGGYGFFISFLEKKHSVSKFDGTIFFVSDMGRKNILKAIDAWNKKKILETKLCRDNCASKWKKEIWLRKKP